MKKVIVYCLVALFATLLSSFVAAGWPLAYLVDHHGISPQGSVSLILGFLGDDHIRKADFLLTFVFWLAISVSVRNGVKRWRTRV